MGQLLEQFQCNFHTFVTLSIFFYRKYSAIVFIVCIRFETCKRKLQYLTFQDFYECSQALMNFWTYSYQHSSHHDYFDTEMDKEFLLDLRELKTLLDKEKEIKQLVSSAYLLLNKFIQTIFFNLSSLVLMRLKPLILDRCYQELDTNFRLYYRAIVTIATNIHRSRDLRLLFVELTEKLIEPWKQNNWNLEQAKLFLPAVTQSVLDLEGPRDHQDIVRCLWDRYMQVITICLVQMYH